MDGSLPGYSIHGIFQARVLDWVAISFSRGFSRPRDWTQVSQNAGRYFTVWTTREAQELGKPALTSPFCLSPIHVSLYSNYSLRAYYAPGFNLGCRVKPVPTLHPPAVGGHANTDTYHRAGAWPCALSSPSLGLCFRSWENNLELASSLQGSLPTSGLQPNRGLMTKPGSQSAASAQPRGH